ncbi:MAG: hypothetical protein HY822_00725 [Acidobacteria bacterium]|nr:hypothetical protein [Acidobacteriota bacterium]
MFLRRTAAAILFLSASAGAREIAVTGTHFALDGKPFPYTGVSFFNAIYNPSFNQSSEERWKWIEKFQRYGINVLRVWAQWDSKRGFVDACSECTLYYPDGRLRQDRVERLKQILTDADRAGMVVQLALFARESWNEKIRLEPAAADRAVAGLTRELKPWRNLTFQVWNEFSDRVLDHVKTIRAGDPARLVTNSPGFAGDLGDPAQNRALDYLTPHTSRQTAGKTWDIAPKEIAYLLALYRKPVVDDEPARTGTPNFGGPRDKTWPADHIVQIQRVWQAGGCITYHHDMFQTGYNTPAVPPSGVPDPEFSPYHRAVFEFIALRQRYMPARPGPLQ